MHLMRQYIYKMQNNFDIQKDDMISDNHLYSQIPQDYMFMNILKFIETKTINFIWLGQIDYNIALSYQRQIHKLIQDNKVKDTILLLEHPHVYTFGKNADKNHLLPSYNKEADVIQTDRGGEITYHGPGQLVVYPIMNLARYKKSITWYINTIEKVIIDSLKQYNIKALRKEGLIGVWVEEEKIAAIGVRLSKWITMHGFALNINPNMKFYNGMIPCGIFEYGITSIFQLTKKNIEILDLVQNIINHIVLSFKEINEI